MKHVHLTVLAASACLFAMAPVFAQESEAEAVEDAVTQVVESTTEETAVAETKEEKAVTSPLSFYVTTDMAYYPLSASIAGSDHFAPVTGAYSGLEGRITGHMDYKINTPLGENWLLNSANVVLGTTLEVSPVSVKPGVNASFTPLPFLVFSAGAEAGTGWDLAGLQGMAVFNGTSYDDLTPFVNYFVKWWAQGTFQFDTGALIPGDWTHVVMMYSYQVYYEGLTGVEDGQIWEWQCSTNRANGLEEYQCGILAYQMPLVLYRVGVMVESNGHYNDSDYDSTKYANYYGSFKQISISPLLQFKFDDHNTLNVLIGFSSRRSYTTEHTEGTE